MERTSYSWIKHKAFRLVESVENATPIERAVDIFLLIAIFVSVVFFIIGTVPAIATEYAMLIAVADVVAVAIFTLEYMIHLWACTVNEGYRHPFFGRIRYALKPMMMVDLLAILPFFLSMFGGHFLILRILRLFRVARILKINRYSSALTAIRRVLHDKRPELLISISMMLTLIILTSTLLFYVESDIEGTVFTSIPAAMWTSVASVTPLGFAQAYPETIIGRVLMMLTAIFGVGTFALPSGIFASGFSEQLKSVRDTSTQTSRLPVVCPHCNHVIDAQRTHKL